MKKWIKILAVVLCLCLLQTPVMESVTSVTEVQAAVKKGLKKEKGKYYYYYKGKKVKNTWKSVKVKNEKTKKMVTYRYYFGKNGAAYQGGSKWGEPYLAVKTIKGKKYGFDRYGRMVKGDYVSKGSFYCFNSKNGRYDAKRTKKLRSASKEGAGIAALFALIGNPKKRTAVPGCYGDGQEYELEYTNFRVGSFVSSATGKETVFEVVAK